MPVVKRLLATVIIAWGLLALLVRAATPLVDGLRPEIQQALTDALGTPVSIQVIAARWHGARPLIELRGIQVGPTDELLEVRKAALELAPLGWLSQLGGGDRRAFLDGLKLTLEGMALTVVREPDGRFHVEGYGPLGTAEPPPLPRRLHLVDTEIRWVDRKLAAPTIALSDVAIRLTRDGERLDLRARFATPAGTADATARLNGFLGRTDWAGDSYLHVTDLDVARLLAPYLPQRYGFESLSLNLEAWTRWTEARPSHVQGTTSLRDLSLRPTFEGAGRLEIDAASAAFSLRRTEDNGLNIGLRHLRLAMPDGIWPETAIALGLARAADAWTLDLFANHLGLDAARRIAGVRPIDSPVREAADALRPRGQLNDLHLRLERHDDALDWRIATRFENLGLDSWRGVPAIEGLAGELSGTADQVQLGLDSTNTRLTFDKLFRDTLTLDRLAGQVSIYTANDGWSVKSDRLVAVAPHLETVTRFQLRKRRDERLFVDLQSAFADGDAGGASRYYPVGVMRPSLVRWLDRSISTGRVTSGSALFHGAVGDFAFEKTRSGAFEVIVDVEDMDLDYRPGWPMLHALAARLRFHGNQLDIDGSAGRIYDSRIEQVTARIASLKPISPVEIKGSVTGPLRDNLRVLQEDALRPRLGAFAEGLDGQGDTRLELDFAIPLKKRGETRAQATLDGTLQFSNNSLSVMGSGIVLTEIDGALHFDLEGVSAEGIRARGLGSPLSIDVEKRDRGITRIQAEGLLGIGAIGQQWPSLPLWFASGEADFALTIDVPAQLGAEGAQRLMRIESGLEGIAIDLPAPLGKTAAARETLTAQLPLDPGPVTSNLRYGKSLASRFDSGGRRLGIRFDGVLPPLPGSNGVHLSGELAELDLAAWYARLSTAPEGKTGALPDVSGQVRIGRLLGLPSPFESVEVQVRPLRGDWQIVLDGAQLSGEITLPADLSGRPISAKLERLVLELPVAETDATAPPPKPHTDADPSGLPGLALNVEALQVNAARLGQLTAIAEPDAKGWMVRELSLAGETETLDAEARWQRDDNGTRTWIEGYLETAGLGDLLVNLGYARQVEDTPGRIGFGLDWAGDPSQAHRTTLQGELSISLEGGRMVELDPGVTRIVGLFNLNALTRRLRLDFSDLFKRGYSFDTIDGTFRFANGSAVTDQLSVVGPAGRIEISGSTDLAARTIDHQVQVTPKLDATLPIASTIAGGPIAGLAVFVAQKLMSEQIDEINRFDYRVNGSWADPQITQLDSGGALSKVLKPVGANQALVSQPIIEEPEPTQPTVAIPGPGPAADGEGPERADEALSDNPLRGVLDFLKNRTTDIENLPVNQD